MNASDYLQRSTLYRKLIHGPFGEFARVYAGRLSDEGFGRQWGARCRDRAGPDTSRTGEGPRGVGPMRRDWSAWPGLAPSSGRYRW
ncbi:MAG: hypothetical protein E5X58_35265 [Mesorhizobium sp.]|nr:MAG: hypothetical protein E5X58_35265 [Mesorhizobium sp.]